MSSQQGMLGIFSHLDDLLHAMKGIREKNVEIHTVYSPARNEEIIEALNMKPSPVRYFALAGGLLGILSGFALSIYTAEQWRFVVWGKPPVPLVPYVIEAFEFCILFAVLSSLLGILIYGRLPKVKLPEHYDRRFSEDRYGVLVFCSNTEREDIMKIMNEAGADEVRDVQR